MGLILGYKPGDRIFVGDNITIVGLPNHGGMPRIRIDAPGNVKIMREKVLQRIADKAAAAGKAPETGNK